MAQDGCSSSCWDSAATVSAWHGWLSHNIATTDCHTISCTTYIVATYTNCHYYHCWKSWCTPVIITRWTSPSCCSSSGCCWSYIYAICRLCQLCIGWLAIDHRIHSCRSLWCVVVCLLKKKKKRFLYIIYYVILYILWLNALGKLGNITQIENNKKLQFKSPCSNTTKQILVLIRLNKINNKTTNTNLISIFLLFKANCSWDIF